MDTGTAALEAGVLAALKTTLEGCYRHPRISHQLILERRNIKRNLRCSSISLVCVHLSGSAEEIAFKNLLCLVKNDSSEALQIVANALSSTKTGVPSWKCFAPSIISVDNDGSASAEQLATIPPGEADVSAEQVLARTSL